MQAIKNIFTNFIITIGVVVGCVLFMCLTIFTYTGWFISIALMFFYGWIGFGIFIVWILSACIFSEIVGSIRI
jgi:hypothetical protein